MIMAGLICDDATPPEDMWARAIPQGQGAACLRGAGKGLPQGGLAGLHLHGDDGARGHLERRPSRVHHLSMGPTHHTMHARMADLTIITSADSRN